MRDKKRWPTDILLLFAIFCVWVTMTLLGFVSIGIISSSELPKGDPQRLLAEIDYNDRICGYSSGVTSKPNAYYMLDKTVVCVASCPTSTSYTKFICQDDYQSSADSSQAYGFLLTAAYKCNYEIETTAYVSRCIPNVDTSTAASGASTAAATQGVTISSSMSYEAESSTWFQTFFSDVYNNLGLTFGFGVGVTCFTSFIFLLLLRIPGILFLTIWAILIGILGLLVVGSFLMWDVSSTWADAANHTTTQATMLEALSYIGMGFAGLYLCVLVVIGSRVQLAIGVIKEAAKSMAAMPAILAVPLLQVTGLVAFLAVWMVYCVYLASSGEFGTTTSTYYDSTGTQQSYTYKSFNYTTNTKYAFIFMLFCWFWTSEFIVAMGQMIVSLAVSCWYFARDKSTTGSRAVLWALKTAVIYHAGTAAFGSLVIAIIKMIRAGLAYITKKAKMFGNNMLIKYFLLTIACLVWCLEKFMKFMNKNAYVHTAIYGDSFCFAAKNAFFLLLRNILRVSAVNFVSTFILFIGKLFSPTLTVFILYFICAYDSTISTNVNDLTSLLVFIWIIGYFVSAIFTEIFGMAIETILLCFIADEEMFEPALRHGDGGLKSVVSFAQQADAGAAVSPSKDTPPPNITLRDKGAAVSQPNEESLL